MTNTTGTSATSDASKYSFGPPAISALNPSGGPLAGGSANKVTITGTGFTGLEGAVAVKFGIDSAIAYTVDSPTQITATPPAHSVAEAVQVTVTNPVGTSDTAPLANDYTYGGPTITSVSPAAGPIGRGDSVVIAGSGFNSVTSVKFGIDNATAYTVNSSTQITATVPAGTEFATVQVMVVAGGLATPDTRADDYSYGAPSVTSLTPNGGPTTGGNQVVIKGKGFSGVSAVRFGDTLLLASRYTVDGPEQITVNSAPTGSGAVYVTVTTPAGTSATGSANQYTYGVPTITSVSPVAGQRRAATTSSSQARTS